MLGLFCLTQQFTRPRIDEMDLRTSVADNGSILIFGNVAAFHPLLDWQAGIWTGEDAKSHIFFVGDLASMVH